MVHPAMAHDLIRQRQASLPRAAERAPRPEPTGAPGREQVQRVAMTGVRPRPSPRVVSVVLLLAVIVSIAHYVDNTVRFDDYAKDPSTPVTPTLVVGSWVVFTAVAIYGYDRYRRGRYRTASVAFACYSLSGLIGLGHYRDAPPSRFDAVQNTLIVTDVALGVAVLLIAVAILSTNRSEVRQAS